MQYLVFCFPFFFFFFFLFFTFVLIHFCFFVVVFSLPFIFIKEAQSCAWLPVENVLSCC